MIYFRIATPEDGLYRLTSVKPFTYPAGEQHLKGLPDHSWWSRSPANVWIADVRGNSETLDADLTRAHAFANVAHGRQAPFALMLPYLPAGRSDRGEPTGVVVYAQRIAAMNPQQVITIDWHSPLTATLFRREINKGELEKDSRVTELSAVPLVEQALSGGRTYDGVIAPDEGARDRAAAVAAVLKVPCYQADKHRDFDTGRIESIEMVDPLPKDGRFLVVDDICDGGGTFIGLAEATRLPKERLGLWVTHFTGNERAIQLRDRYEHIYTTDSHDGHNAFGPADQADSSKRVHIVDGIVRCETYMMDHLRRETHV